MWRAVAMEQTKYSISGSRIGGVANDGIDAYAPYSYIGLAGTVVSVFLFSLARGAEPS
jgi:hypothetical protein